MKLLLLSTALSLFFVSCDRGQKVAKLNEKNDWIYDSTQTKIIEGEGYVLLMKKAQPQMMTGEIDPKEAIEMIQHHDTATRSFVGRRSFFVEFQLKEFVDYTRNISEIADVDRFRMYFGVYPPGHQPNGGRFTSILVALGADGKEKYSDNVAGMQLLNIGTLCPTNCPTNDNRALHTLAGLPSTE